MRRARSGTASGHGGRVEKRCRSRGPRGGGLCTAAHALGRPLIGRHSLRSQPAPPLPLTRVCAPQRDALVANDRAVVITNTSPLFKRTVEVAYKNIKEIRTAPRGFGLWGDMVSRALRAAHAVGLRLQSLSCFRALAD